MATVTPTTPQKRARFSDDVERLDSPASLAPIIPPRSPKPPKRIPRSDRRRQIQWNLLFQNFAGWTSLVGIQHIGSAPDKKFTLVWTMIFLGSLLMFLWHCSWLASQFLAYKKDTSVILLQNFELTFPAVTLCNLNPYKRSKLDLAPEISKLLSAFNYLAQTSSHRGQANQTLGEDSSGPEAGPEPAAELEHAIETRPPAPAEEYQQPQPPIDNNPDAQNEPLSNKPTDTADQGSTETRFVESTEEPGSQPQLFNQDNPDDPRPRQRRDTTPTIAYSWTSNNEMLNLCVGNGSGAGCMAFPVPTSCAGDIQIAVEIALIYQLCLASNVSGSGYCKAAGVNSSTCLNTLNGGCASIVTQSACTTLVNVYDEMCYFVDDLADCPDEPFSVCNATVPSSTSQPPPLRLRQPPLRLREPPHRLRQPPHRLRQPPHRLRQPPHRPDNLHIDSANLHIDSANLHIDSANLHIDPDNLHIDSVNLHIDSANLHIDSANLHIDSANLHIDSANLHIDSANLHIDSANLHIDSANLHIDLANLHIDPDNLHIDSVNLHIDSANLHIDSANLHIDPDNLHFFFHNYSRANNDHHSGTNHHQHSCGVSYHDIR